jgi:hypothetical protein
MPGIGVAAQVGSCALSYGLHRLHDADSSRWLSRFPVARHLIMSRWLLPTGRMVLVGCAWFRIGLRTVRVPGTSAAGGGTSCARLGEAGAGAGTPASTCPGRGRGRRRLRRGGYLSCDATADARDRLRVTQPGDPGERRSAWVLSECFGEELERGDMLWADDAEVLAVHRRDLRKV